MCERLLDKGPRPPNDHLILGEYAAVLLTFEAGGVTWTLDATATDF
jgi:hypothetical protein